MDETRYFLRPHVCLCATPRYLVVLDLRRDLYLSIPREHFDPVIPWLPDWPLPERTMRVPAAPGSDACAAAAAAALMSQGILTSDPCGSKPVQPTLVRTPNAEIRRGPASALCARLMMATGFFLACRRADSALKSRRLEDVVRAVERRRRASAGRGGALCIGRAVRLSRIFAGLRLLYPRAYLCTFDSLALLEFLALRRIYPQWVFGVQADPFQAHCWVQLGTVLLNDGMERIRAFTPILAV